MRRIQTIEDDFEFQAKKIIETMLEDCRDEVQEAKSEGETLDGFLWKNRNTLGEIFLSRLNDYMDVNELAGEEWDTVEETESEDEN